MSEGRNAVCCISGGVDSVTTAYYVKKVLKPKKMLLVFCDYRQRTYEYEEFCIRQISKRMGAPLKLIDLRWLGGISTSVLTHPERAIPETKEGDLWDPEKARRRILRWWDPCRNSILLLVGLAHAESFYISKHERYDVYIGIRRETPVAMKDNCVAGDTMVYIVKGESLTPIKIKDLCDSHFNGGQTGFVDVSNENLFTFSLNASGRIVRSRISHLYREVPKHSLVEISTMRFGSKNALVSKITTTDNHTIYSVNAAGEFVPVEASSLKPLTPVAVPRRLPFDGRPSGLSKDFLKFIGLWLGDGMVIKKDRPWTIISVGNDQEAVEVLNGVTSKLLLKLNQFRTSERHPELRFLNGVDVKLDSRQLIDKMTSLGFEGQYCEDRVLPEWVYSLTNDELRCVWWGWWKSDSGYTVSNELAEGMNVIALRLGIPTSSSAYLNYYRYPNGGHSKARLLHRMFASERKLVYLPLYLRKLVFGEKYAAKAQFTRLDVLRRTMTASDSPTRARVDEWLRNDVDFAVVKEVKKVSPERFVYDLTIPNHHNFVAEKFIVHNTPEFLEEMNRLGEQATHHGGYRLLAPLITYDKDKVVKLGEELGVPWEYTYSCYKGFGFTKRGGRRLPVHCNSCSNCKRRKLAFRDAGVDDPSVYAA